MKKRLLIILLIVLAIGAILTVLILNHNKEKTYHVSLKDNEAIAYFTIQFKTDSVKITGDNEVASICKMLDGELKRDAKSDKTKGWIYKIIAMDSNDNPVETFFVIEETTIRINDKAYTCKAIDTSKIDELAGINRES